MMEMTLKSGHIVIVSDADYKKVSKIKWHLDKDGYAVSLVGGRKGKAVRLHRMILGAEKHEICDHINGNRLDCRRENLRKVDRVGNGQNVARHRDNKSGFKGVFLCKQTGRWRARLMANGVIVELGRFTDKEIAAREYDNAAKLHHGKYARLNFTETAA